MVKRQSMASDGPAGGGVALVLGTRPEMIKLAPVVSALSCPVRLLHTGQHYDHQVSGAFLRDLGLPEPERTFAVGGMSRMQQVASAVSELDEVFEQDRPDLVIVQGDTNATLAGALAANGRGITLLHVEAGLRSDDRQMPEEHNRILTDHLSDILCAATDANATNLLAERIDLARIHITGNTVVEAALAGLPGPGRMAEVLQHYGLMQDGYVLATLHRPENTDDPEVLAAILAELDQLAGGCGRVDGVRVLMPMHPRTRAAVRRYGFARLLSRITVTDPLRHEEFVSLLARAAVVVSDSGGVQEEVTVFKRPLIVVRRSTERPESIPEFARLVPPGSSPGIAAVAREWLSRLPQLHARLANLPSPYGDAAAGRRIAEIAMRAVEAARLTTAGARVTSGA